MISKPLYMRRYIENIVILRLQLSQSDLEREKIKRLEMTTLELPPLRSMTLVNQTAEVSLVVSSDVRPQQAG